MNKEQQLLLLEKAILKNEALTSNLCAKWHGKPESVGRDIFLIASTIVELNLKHNIIKESSFESNSYLDKF